MNTRLLNCITLILFAALDGIGQGQQRSGTWKVPRTPEGQPDLQGIWTNANLTPLQRPAELGDKQFFSEQEAAAYEKQRIQQTDVDRIDAERGPADLARRAYNNFWFDRGTHVVKSRRTSLIVDPPDGKIPQMTAEAVAGFPCAAGATSVGRPGRSSLDRALHSVWRLRSSHAARTVQQ